MRGERCGCTRRRSCASIRSAPRGDTDGSHVETNVLQESRRGRGSGRRPGGAREDASRQAAGAADRQPDLAASRDDQGRPLCALAATLAEIGVEAVEMCSPFGYEEFAALTDGKQVRKILADHGLACQSGHFGMDELRTKQSASIAWAHDVGITQMVTATLDAGDTPTLDDVKRAADGIQQDRGGRGEGGHSAGAAQRGVRALAGRRPADIRHPARSARSGAREVPVPDVDDQRGLRRARVLHEVSRPLQFDAPAGRGPERGAAPRARAASAARPAACRRRLARAASTG